MASMSNSAEVLLHDSLRRGRSGFGAPGAPLTFNSCGPKVYDDAHIDAGKANSYQRISGAGARE